MSTIATSAVKLGTGSSAGDVGCGACDAVGVSRACASGARPCTA